MVLYCYQYDCVTIRYNITIYKQKLKINYTMKKYLKVINNIRQVCYNAIYELHGVEKGKLDVRQ